MTQHPHGHHFITKCSCGKVIAQCRCPSTDKIETTLQEQCPTCLAKKQHASVVSGEQHPLNLLCATCGHEWQYHSFIKPHPCLAGRDINYRAPRDPIAPPGACNCPAFEAMVSADFAAIEGDALMGALAESKEPDVILGGIRERQRLEAFMASRDPKAEIERLQHQIALVIPYCLPHVKDGESACQTAARLLRDSRATREQLAILAQGVQYMLSQFIGSRTEMIRAIGTSEELLAQALEAGLQLARELAA